MAPASPVELERIGAVAVCRFLLQVLGEVDDSDRIKGAFLGRHKAGVTRVSKSNNFQIGAH